MPELELHGLMTGSANETNPRMESLNCLVTDLKSLAALKAQSDLYAIRFSVDKKGQDYYQFIGAETTRFEALSAMFVRSKLPGGCILCMDITEGELALARSYLFSSWMPGAGLEARDDRQILRLKSDEDCTEKMLAILIPLKENRRMKDDQGDNR